MFLLELIENGPTIRGMAMADGQHVYAVYDFIAKACQKENESTYAKNTFYRLIRDGSEHKLEVDSFCVYLKFPGAGQRETPCATIRGLQRLLMILGGKVASEFRKLVEGTFTRVMAGDQSLIEVINANAASDAPVQQAFRRALEHDPVEPVLDDICLLKRKRKEEELELVMVERRLAIEERKSALEAIKINNTKNKINNTTAAVDFLDSLKLKSNIDERTKMQFEDNIKNTILASSRLIVATTSSPNDQSNAPTQVAVNETEALTVSVVARELGFKPSKADNIRIGKTMTKAYKATYGEDAKPDKHRQYTDGAYIPVNSYIELDRPMLEWAIRYEMGATTGPMPKFNKTH